MRMPLKMKYRNGNAKWPMRVINVAVERYAGEIGVEVEVRTVCDDGVKLARPPLTKWRAAGDRLNKKISNQ